MANVFSKRAVMVLSVVAMLGAGSPAMAEGDDASFYENANPSGGEMLADLFIVRPISLVGTVLGAAAFVVTLPLTVPTGSVGAAGKELVVQPGKYTFYRPLGDFDHCGRSGSPCGNR